MPPAIYELIWISRHLIVVSLCVSNIATYFIFGVHFGYLIISLVMINSRAFFHNHITRRSKILFVKRNTTFHIPKRTSSWTLPTHRRYGLRPKSVVNASWTESWSRQSGLMRCQPASVASWPRLVYQLATGSQWISSRVDNYSEVWCIL